MAPPSPRRRPAIAASALVGVVVVAVSVMIGATLLAEPPNEPLFPITNPVLVTDIGTPQEADPCALINLDSLRPFGEPRLTKGPLLQSCQANIETTHNDDNDNVELRVILGDHEPASELEGGPQQIGERTIVRSGIVPYWGTQACRNYLVLTADEPKIAIYALTNDDEATDLCAVAEAATTAAMEVLDRDGGITYIQNRTASYSHASSNACSLLDNATLTMIPGLDPERSPDYADWSCHWDTKDEDHGVSLHFRLEATPLTDFYEEQPQVTVAGKRAFLDSSKELSVQSRFGNAKLARQLGETINTDSLPAVLRGRRSQVHLELGWVAAGQGDDALAVLHLLEAERVAAQAVSRNKSATRLLGILLARERRSATPSLRGLVSRAGLIS